MTSYNTDNFGQNMRLPQHNLNQPVHPDSHSQSHNMYRLPPPYRHNLMPPRPELRPRGPPAVSNWNVPPPHFHNTNFMAGGRPSVRVQGNVSVGQEGSVFKNTERIPPTHFQDNSPYIDPQTLPSAPTEFHGMRPQNFGMRHQRPPMPNIQHSNFASANDTSCSNTSEPNLVEKDIPNQNNYFQNRHSNNANHFQGVPPNKRFYYKSHEGRAFVQNNIDYTDPEHQSYPSHNYKNSSHQGGLALSVRNSIQGGGVDQKKTEDEIWLANWLKKKQLLKQDGKKFKNQKEETTTKLSFPQARSLVKESVTLVSQLKSVLEEFKEDGLHEDTRKEKLNHAESIKTRLEGIKSTLSNKDIQNYLSVKLEQRRKMRERQKRKRKHEYEARLEEESRRKLKHEEIDKWQQAIYDQIQDHKREKELKTIADKTLQEVNRKMTDVNKSLQVLEGLAKLREVRKDSMQRKGLYPPKDSGPIFEARFNLQKEALEKQKKLYEAEKGLLEVMLKTEQEECKEYEEEEITRNREEKEQQMEQLIREHLFGRESKPEMGDPMFGFWLFYNAANQSPEGLCAIRAQWDSYLTTDPAGSPLPSTWVLPAQPASHTWASALKS